MIRGGGRARRLLQGHIGHAGNTPEDGREACSHPRRNGIPFRRHSYCDRRGPEPARADGAGVPDFGEYLQALATLNRSEIVAMVLTLGVLLFGVVTAVLLVRTRIRAGLAESALRDRIATLRADHDRLQTL